MSRVWHTGIEAQLIPAEFGFNQGWAVDTTTKHGGAASARANASIAADDVAELESPPLGSLTDFFWRVYFNPVSMPNNSLVSLYCGSLSAAGTNVINVDMTYNGTNLVCTVYYNDFGTVAGTFNVPMNQFFYLEFHYDSTPADGSEILEVKLDGVTQITLTNLTYAQKNINLVNFGVYNGTASPLTTHEVYCDDIAVNSSAGSVNNSWCGDEKIVASVPAAAGDNAATAGLFSSVNEIPWTDTATSSANRIELDSNGVIADYEMTDIATLGIDTYDTISAILVLGRIREEAAGASSYQLRIKAVSGGTVTSTAAADAGNATARTNPAGTTAYGRLLVSETNPTTGVAWTPSDWNAAQIGLANVDADSTPDLWCTAMAAMIAYKEGTPPAGGNSGFLQFM